MKTKTKELSAQEQNELDLKRETLNDALKELLAAPQETVALVERSRDVSTGRYTPKKKLSKAAKSMKLHQRILATRNAEGKSKEQELVEHLIKTALDCGPSDLMAATKAYSEIQSRTIGKVSESEESLNALMRSPVQIVILTAPDLPNQGELEERKLLRPSWENPPYIDGTIISENPAPKEQ